MSPHSIAVAQTLTAIAAGALAAVLAKLALGDVAPFTFVWLQIAIGGTLLSLYTFVIRGERLPRQLGRRAWLYLIAIGIGNFTIVRVTFMLGLGRLPATTHVYLVNFVGIATMAISVAMLRERPTAWQILGAIVALVGLRVFFPEVPPPDELTGVVYVGLGVLTLATTNNLTRKLALDSGAVLSNNIVSTVALWIGGIPVVLAGLTLDGPLPGLSARNWGILLTNAVIGIAIGLTVFNHVLRTLRSYEASILASTGVIFTAVLAIPILGETLDTRQAAGIAMMLVGIAMVQLRRRGHRGER